MPLRYTEFMPLRYADIYRFHVSKIYRVHAYEMYRIHALEVYIIFTPEIYRVCALSSALSWELDALSSTHGKTPKDNEVNYLTCLLLLN